MSAVLCAAFNACTTISVSGAQGLQTETRFGLSVITPTPSGAGAWIRTKGYGLTLTHSGASLGVVEERTYIANSAGACSIVVIAETQADEERIRRHFIPVLKEQPDICFTHGETK